MSRDNQGNWGAPRTLMKGGDLAIWGPDGRGVLTAVKGDGGRFGLAIVPVGASAPRVVVPLRDPAAAPIHQWAWSSDGRFVYYLGQSPGDQRTGIWRVPAAGGTPRLMVWFDEPNRSLHRPWFRVRGNRFYFTLGDQQSDIWTTEVLGSGSRIDRTGTAQ